MNSNRRLIELDALRGVAIIFVIFDHSIMFIPWDIWGGKFIAPFPGVTLFFVISGYSITLSLFAHRRTSTASSIKAFMWRRFWRIQPLSLIWVGLILLGSTIANTAGYFGSTTQNLESSFYVLTMLANWKFVSRESLGAFGVYWSLAIEEQFYLIYPFVFFGLKSKRALLWACIAAFVALEPFVRNPYLTEHLGRFSLLGEFLQGPWYQPILVGVIVYIVSESFVARFDTKYDRPLRILGFGCMLLMPALYILTRDASLIFDGSQLFYTPVLSGCVVFAAALSQRNAAFVGSKALSWVGTRSYGLYLSHFPCSMLMREFWHAVAPAPNGAGTLLVITGFSSYAIVTLGVTEVLHRFVELPLMEYGRRSAERLFQRQHETPSVRDQRHLTSIDRQSP
ncbi:acyltransferase family protein [Paraburkholderia largidicola]|uniref:acyltransferase family protein n=1 Tax=Paraburkholderia largidicola TaxID=3014751 RepID=UPI0015D9ED92|nr:acyltransferase [Paraburkholderia sp. PGU16]